ncbi:glycine receptor subunit alphaZ1-like [Mytilus trossulus]|uniref:glycine receptor subunit alphaZ1-like n=1 Tax=Mytilus trossulus TaxID=6551 RepID=UPI0030065032
MLLTTITIAICIHQNIATFDRIVCQSFNSTKDNTRVEEEGEMIRESIIKRILSRYDKRYPPRYNSDIPTEVKVQMYVVGVFGIDESEMKFSMSMYLRQQWIDPRLMFSAPSEISRIELDHSVQDCIWVPDLSFMTDMDTKIHDVTVPNKMMFLHPNGFVSYSLRVTGTFTCFMQLQTFPFDEQSCVLELESYGFSASTVSLRWMEPAMTLKDGIVNSQFNIKASESYICDKEYPSGNYTCIGVNVNLKREYGFYLIQVYAPSALIVVLSWVSFWLNTDAIPARVSLGILTVLSVSTNGHFSVGLTQRVSYVRAIDVWNVVCLLFVFGAMIEYAYVAMIERVEERRTIERIGMMGNNHNIFKEQVPNAKEDTKKKNSARSIDKLSRAVFPLVFVIFNVIYWLYYMT